MISDTEKDKVLEKGSTKSRTRLIVAFALTYPFASLLVQNAIWRHADDRYLDLLGKNNALSYTLLLIHIVPGFLALLWLPIRPVGRKLWSMCGIAVVYLLLMFPLAYVFRAISYCIFNPHCAPL